MLNWDDMLLPTISFTEKILRPILVYFFLLAGLRLAGKRELAQLNAMDLVVLLMIANTVQNAIIGDDNSVLGGMVGAAALLAINYLVVRFLYSHERVDRLIEGEPICLIENGKMHPKRLERELITRAELESAAHKQGFPSLDQVDRAVLEPGGVISFVGKEPTLDVVRHGEITKQLAEINRGLADLRALVAAGK